MATASERTGNVLRVVSGRPEDAELAAVIAVLTALLTSGPAAAQQAADPEASQPATRTGGEPGWTAPAYGPPGAWTSR